MTARGRWGVSVFISVIFALGCSSPPPRTSPRALELAEAVCGFMSRCCTASEQGYYAGPFADSADCAERLVAAAALDTNATFGGIPVARVNLPNLSALDRAVRDGRVRLDRAAIRACVAWLDEQTCNRPSATMDDWSVCDPVEPPLVAPCDTTLLIEGRVPEGGACSGSSASFECRAGLVCLSDPAGLGDDGTCVALQREGEPCTTSDHCAAGLVCNLVDGTCQPPAALGEACVYSDADDPWPSEALLLLGCEASLTCSPLTSTCVARCEPGAECGEDEDCGEDTDLVCVRWDARFGATGFCDFPRSEGERCSEDPDCAGSRCALDPITQLRVCQPKLANGEPCNLDEHCGSGYCEYSDGESRCAATVANGEPCEAGYDQQCSDGFCAEDVEAGDWRCFARLAIDEPCTNDSACVSRSCVLNACAPESLSDGEPCEEHFHCESLFCNDGETEPRCRSLPLGIGAPCPYARACASGVCFNGSCQSGAAVGEPCGEGLFPCNPTTSFCDVRREVPECTAFQEVGESCVHDDECRVECTTRWGRRMCSPGSFGYSALCDGV